MRFLTLDNGNLAEKEFSYGYIRIADYKASGSEGGTKSSDTWDVRDLNTVTDGSDLVSLSSNQITLQPGTYRCNIQCPAYRVDQNQARLYNVTDSETVLVGSSAFCSAYVQDYSVIAGQFTLYHETTLEVQHWSLGGFSNQGMGYGTDSGEDAVFTVAEFWRLSNFPSSLYARVSDRKSSGSGGGTFTSGAWRTRTLNTIENGSGLVSLSSNRITVPAGTYQVKIKCPAYRVQENQARLYDVTGSSVLLVGTSSYTEDAVEDSSFIMGEIELNSETELEVQHWCSSSYSTFGFGVASSSGEDAIFTIVELWKVG